jgi:hypothetical protein
MGQSHSRQATQVRSQVTSKRDGLERRRSKRTQRATESHVDGSRVTARSSHQDDRTALCSRTAINVLSNNRNVSQPMSETDGNVGAPRRKKQNGRGKATDNQTRPRAPQSDPTHEGVGSKEKVHILRTPYSKPYRGKNGSRHVKTIPVQECIICADTRPSYRFPDRPPTGECTHHAEACRRCLRTWIQSEFSTKIWNEINCPMCAARMQYDDIRQFAPHEVFCR